MKKSVDYARLGIKIKEMRSKRGLTQDQLAELVGCNISHISNIENNYTKASLNVAISVANSLDTTLDYLLAEQYNDTLSVLDNAILNALKNFDENKKEKILQMIELL